MNLGNRSLAALTFVFVVAVAACGSDDTPTPVGSDAGPGTDAATAEAGVSDAGGDAEEDAGPCIPAGRACTDISRCCNANGCGGVGSGGDAGTTSVCF